MGENTGIIMFLWIVGAPTIGLLLLSFWEPRRSNREHHGSASVRPAQTAYSSDETSVRR